MIFPSFGKSPIEGDWQFFGNGAKIRFEPTHGNNDQFDIVWLDGPDFSIMPGTVIGSATQSAQNGVYDCRIKLDPRHKSDKKRFGRFVVKIDPESADALTITPYEQATKFRIEGLLPYWMRRPIREVDSRPRNLDGARRVGAPSPYVEL